MRYETSPNLSVIFKSYESSSSYKPRIVYQYKIADICYKIQNCYDSSFDDTQVSMILPAINALSQVYHAQFGIAFEMSGSAFRRNDLVDACSLGPNYACTSIGCGSNHHKDIKQILDTLIAEVSDSNDKIVYWTDHYFNIYCEHDSEGNCSLSSPTALAMTRRGFPAIHVLRLHRGASDSAAYRASMIYILAHEMAHSLGLNEQYIYPEHEDSDEECVMKIYDFTAEQIADLIAEMEEDGMFFCESCTRLLDNKIHPNQSEQVGNFIARQISPEGVK